MNERNGRGHRHRLSSPVERSTHASLLFFALTGPFVCIEFLQAQPPPPPTKVCTGGGEAGRGGWRTARRQRSPIKSGRRPTQGVNTSVVVNDASVPQPRPTRLSPAIATLNNGHGESLPPLLFSRWSQAWLPRKVSADSGPQCSLS